MILSKTIKNLKKLPLKLDRDSFTIIQDSGIKGMLNLSWKKQAIMP